MAGQDERTRATQDAGITELVFVVDESGSMCGLESDTIGGVNGVLGRNRQAGGTCMVTLVCFSNESRTVVDREDLAQVADLTKRDYQPGGCTALLDALGGTIEHIGRVQRYVPLGHKASHVLFVVVTDGLENASRRYGYPQVRRLVQAKREEGWEFLFLGANIDEAAEADRLGIDPACASAYVSDAAGTAVAYGAVAEASVDFREAGAVPKGWRAAPMADAARRARR